MTALVIVALILAIAVGYWSGKKQVGGTPGGVVPIGPVVEWSRLRTARSFLMGRDVVSDEMAHGWPGARDGIRRLCDLAEQRMREISEAHPDVMGAADMWEQAARLEKSQ
jgi:hypothetical protein